MRSFRGRSACHDASSPVQKGKWGGPWVWLLLGIAISLGWLAVAGGSDPAEAQSYSAYSDPDKAALASVLSEEENAREFQTEFDLDDQEMDSVLAAVREENETLARAYGESQQRIEASGGESESAVSEYNAALKEAVAATKTRIETLLGEDRAEELRAWVDAEFAREGQEAAESAVADAQSSANRSRSLRCKVYATYYDAFTRYEVALPHRSLKFRNRHRKVPIQPVNGGRSVKAPVKEVGPWNTYDNYWQSRTTSEKKNEWRNLPRCVPEAQAAFYRNFHGGKDEQGRTVRNPAGVDLTLAVAKRMGIKDRIKRHGKVRVFVRFPWVRR